MTLPELKAAYVDVREKQLSAQDTFDHFNIEMNKKVYASQIKQMELKLGFPKIKER